MAWKRDAGEPGRLTVHAPRTLGTFTPAQRSNMMGTIILRLQRTLRRRTDPQVKADVNKDAPDAPPLRRDDSRFKVVNKKEKAFFEVIYSKMTEEYRYIPALPVLLCVCDRRATW